MHCERVLAVVKLSAGWRPARALGPVVVGGVGTVVCSARPMQLVLLVLLVHCLFGRIAKL